MTENIEITDIFKKISDPAKKLLISMTYPSEITGANKPAMLFSSDLEESQFDKAMEELRQYGLIETGKLEGQLGKEKHFVIGEGDRFRLAPNVRKAIFKDILKMKP
jgi:hypothetical protein